MTRRMHNTLIYECGWSLPPHPMRHRPIRTRPMACRGSLLNQVAHVPQPAQALVVSPSLPRRGFRYGWLRG